MLGFDIPPLTNQEERGVTAKAVTRKALQNGLIVLNCGKFGETLRILIPLTIEEPLLHEGLDILEEVLRK